VKSVIQSSRNWLSAAFTLLLLLSNSFAQLAKNAPLSNLPPMLRVLILSGEGDHDWRTTSPFLRQLLLDTGRFEVRLCESPTGLTAKTLSGFDAVVDDYSGPRLGTDTEKALEAFVRTGKGFVVTYGGLAAAARPRSGERIWPGFVELTKVSWPTNAALGSGPPFRLLALKTVRPEHPVMQGLKSNLRTADRPRRGFTLLPGAEILAATDENEPSLFASNSGKGRIFCTTLGCDLGSMEETAFITTFLRGTEWAASGKVTLPSEVGLPAPDTNGVRVLVITGGHDHEASFYGLFDGYKDIGWVPVTDSKLAFQKDLRPKYDVLVFYDFTRDLEDKGKQNLRDFVEGGKGVVVLHHGILNFQKWPWWYEEVVGGRYRLDHEGNIPNSTVKFGEEHMITPVGDHPITAGIGPFHVTDETYQGLFISPNIKPLLTTDNPTSDHTVAWIGPCATSKVVFIQLGHDHSPFRHPSYRALVHNSILWSAGKLP
jgi:type 1 glutamine amidotransferase